MTQHLLQENQSYQFQKNDYHKQEVRSVYTCRFLARLMLLRLVARFLISIVSMVIG